MTFTEWDNALADLSIELDEAAEATLKLLIVWSSPVSVVKTLVVIDVLETQVVCAKNVSQER